MITINISLISFSSFPCVDVCVGVCVCVLTFVQSQTWGLYQLVSFSCK